MAEEAEENFQRKNEARMKKIQKDMLLKAMTEAKKKKKLASKINGKILARQVIRQAYYLVTIFDYFSVTSLKVLQLISTYIKNTIFDQAKYFSVLKLAPKIKYWGMEGLVTKFHNIKTFIIDFYTASVDVNTFLLTFQTTLEHLVLRNFAVEFGKALVGIKLDKLKSL